jgi:hypothetical protein
LISNTLKAVQDCATICEYTCSVLMKQQGVEYRRVQMEVMKDCADICALCCKYMARLSVFSKQLARQCAYICEVCANECFKFQDEVSQYCGRVCLNCARECRAYLAA